MTEDRLVDALKRVQAKYTPAYEAKLAEYREQRQKGLLHDSAGWLTPDMPPELRVVTDLLAELRVGGVTLPAMSEREQAACDFAGVRHVNAMKPSEWEDFLEHERGAGKP